MLMQTDERTNGRMGGWIDGDENDADQGDHSQQREFAN
jgi:hypothetical protein